MIAVFDEADQDGAHDVVVDTLRNYLVKNNRMKLMEKLCERRMVPKVMDEFDCATLLEESVSRYGSGERFNNVLNYLWIYRKLVWQKSVCVH